MDRVQALDVGKKLKLCDQGVSACRSMGCAETRTLSSRIATRTVTLHMLCRPPLEALVEDWFCPLCKEFVKYTCEQDGLFPATYMYAYTTELMYLWYGIHVLRDVHLEILMRQVANMHALSVTCNGMNCSRMWRGS